MTEPRTCSNTCSSIAGILRNTTSSLSNFYLCSTDYPYKNFVRLSAPKFLAGSINAGTYQDYTNYYFKVS